MQVLISLTYYDNILRKGADKVRMDEIGYDHKHDKTFCIDRPNGSGDWLFLIIKTKALFRIGGREIHVKPNSFIMFTPDCPQYYRADNAEYADDWIHFGFSEEETELAERLAIPYNKIVHIGDITQISNIVRNMCYENYSANKNRKETVDLYFRLLLLKLNECMESCTLTGSITKNKYFEKLLWLRESIYRWPARQWNIDDMAVDLSLSRSRLQHLYNDTFGVSISRDIIAGRVEKAKDLLKNPELSINDVSSMVGYNNPSYFNRQFKNLLGKTPTQYREDGYCEQTK